MQKHQTLKAGSKDLILSKEYSLVKLRRENKELEAKISLMQKLTTTYKFYQYYFSNLPRFESSEKCFDYVNQLFFDCFGVYRYINFLDFRFKLTSYGR